MPQRFTQRLLLCLVLLACVFASLEVEAKPASIADFVVPLGFTFNRDLVKGTTTIPDVYFLQNLLNISTSTRVAENDSGSNGKLTAFYGDKTARAVGKFQTVFKTDIEYEKSISTTPGAMNYKLNPNVVDQYSRAVLNKLVVVYSYQLMQYKKDHTIQASSTAIKTDEQKTDDQFDPKKAGFQYSPQGLLLKLIGGDKLVDKVYSYSPVGMIEGGGSSSGGSSAGGAAALGGAFGGGSTGSSGGASASGLMNFGGLVTSMTVCPCSYNTLLYVKDVRGTVLPLMYQPGVTVLYKMYMPTAGANVLGQYVSGGICLIPGYPTCTTGGTPIGTMSQLGTSSI